LTGVVDRLEEKGLVERWSVEGDGRKTIIALTRRGERVFEKEFPRHVEFLKSKFDKLGAGERKQATQLLEKINREGTTIVMVTHDPELAARAHRNIHILDGRASDQASPGPAVVTSLEARREAAHV